MRRTAAGAAPSEYSRWGQGHGLACEKCLRQVGARVSWESNWFTAMERNSGANSFSATSLDPYTRLLVRIRSGGFWLGFSPSQFLLPALCAWQSAVRVRGFAPAHTRPLQLVCQAMLRGQRPASRWSQCAPLIGFQGITNVCNRCKPNLLASGCRLRWRTSQQMSEPTCGTLLAIQQTHASTFRLPHHALCARVVKVSCCNCRCQTYWGCTLMVALLFLLAASVRLKTLPAGCCPSEGC